MANIKKLTVVACTPSTKGGFILKLQNKDAKSVATVFGTVTQTSQSTYYMKVGAAVPINSIGDLDLDAFKITELPYVIPASPATAAVGIAGQLGYVAAKEVTPEEVIQLKWLFL